MVHYFASYQPKVQIKICLFSYICFRSVTNVDLSLFFRITKSILCSHPHQKETGKYWVQNMKFAYYYKLNCHVHHHLFKFVPKLHWMKMAHFSLLRIAAQSFHV